jgi:hypothetical protein
MIRSLLAVLGSAVTCVPVAMAQCGGEFPGLSAAGLTLNGDASFDEEHGRLVLTTPTEGQASSAFANFRPEVANGFATTFTFRIENGSADGFSFIIQHEGPNALGGGGSSMGYSGISHALVIEFDTFSFGPPGEFPSTHVAIHTACSGGVSDTDDDAIAHVVLDGESMNIADGEPHSCTIEFRGNHFYISIDGVEILADVPFDFTNCDGNGETIVSGDGCAYIGFTGATGAATALQTITAWTFDDQPPCVPADLGSFIFDQSVVAGETVTFGFEALGSRPRTFFWILNGQPVEDGGPISGATTGTLTISPAGPEHHGQWDYGVFNECQGVSTGFFLTVEPVCAADYNGDGNLDPDDLADAIACYFTVDCGFDYNGDGNEDPDDLSDYIGVYFAGCP